MFRDEREQRVGVAGAADDLVPVVLEQPREALAQEHRVLGDYDAHGSSTSMPVPRARGAVDVAAAALRGDAIGACRRSPVPASAAAPPTPSSVTVRRRAPAGARWSRHGHAATGTRVLDRVGHRLAGHEVGRRLDVRRRAVTGRLHR